MKKAIRVLAMVVALLIALGLLGVSAASARPLQATEEIAPVETALPKWGAPVPNCNNVNWNYNWNQFIRSIQCN